MKKFILYLSLFYESFQNKKQGKGKNNYPSLKLYFFSFNDICFLLFEKKIIRLIK